MARDVIGKKQRSKYVALRPKLVMLTRPLSTDYINVFVCVYIANVNTVHENPYNYTKEISCLSPQPQSLVAKMDEQIVYDEHIDYQLNWTVQY